MRRPTSRQKNQNPHIIKCIRYLEAMLKISCWNSDWATPSSKRGKFFIDKFDSDIICLTEGYGTIGRALGMSRATVASIVKRELVEVS